MGCTLGGGGRGWNAVGRAVSAPSCPRVCRVRTPVRGSPRPWRRRARGRGGEGRGLGGGPPACSCLVPESGAGAACPVGALQRGLCPRLGPEPCTAPAVASVSRVMVPPTSGSRVSSVSLPPARVRRLWDRTSRPPSCPWSLPRVLEHGDPPRARVRERAGPRPGGSRPMVPAALPPPGVGAGGTWADPGSQPPCAGLSPPLRGRLLSCPVCRRRQRATCPSFCEGLTGRWGVRGQQTGTETQQRRALAGQ